MSPLIMSLTGGEIALLIVVGLGLFFLPTIIAVNRKHGYLGIIIVLNVIGGLFAGLGWVAALIWAVWPAEKSIIDPIVGNTTGTGFRNAGDAVGAAGYGVARGFESERATMDVSTKVVGAAAPVPSDTRICPDCAETVKAAARVCRYCSYQFG